MAGFVYIMSNKSMPGLLKIGVSDRDPEEYRVKELSNTAVPEPFKVEYYAYTENQDEVEREVHRKLDLFRNNNSREFFAGEVIDFIEVIREIAADRIKFEENNYEKLLSQAMEKRWKKIDQIKKEAEAYPKTFHDNGNIKTQGKTKKGERIGYWLTYYSHGKLETIELYESDSYGHIFDFVMYAFYPDGSLESELTDLEGEEWRFDRYDGRVLFNSRYKWGACHGPFESIGDHGREIGSYDQNEKDGDAIYFHKAYPDEYSGYISKYSYKKDKMHGKFSKIKPNYGVIEEGQYVDGKKQGEWISHHFGRDSDGEETLKPTLIICTKYIDGEKEYTVEKLYKDGVIYQSHTLNKWGHPDGMYAEYDNWGNMVLEGKLTPKGRYGVWKTFDSDGKVIEKEDYGFPII